MSLASHAVGRLRKLYRNLVAPSGDTNVALSAPPGLPGGAHLAPLFEALEPRLLLSGGDPQEMLWHEVVVRNDDGTEKARYEVHVTSTQDLSENYLYDDLFNNDIVTGIRVVDKATGEGVTDYWDAHNVLIAAQNAALIKAGHFQDISQFVVAGDLTDDWLSRSGYDYRCIPNHHLAPVSWMLQPLLDGYLTRQMYYETVIGELVTQPQRYQKIMQNGQMSELVTELASPGATLTARAADFLAKITDVGYYHKGTSVTAIPIEIGVWERDDWESFINGFGTKTAQAERLLLGASAVLSGINLAGQLASDAGLAMTFDMLIRMPESLDRVLALEKFIDEYRTWPGHDDALVQAFDIIRERVDPFLRDPEGYASNILAPALTNMLTDPAVYTDIYKFADGVKNAYQGIWGFTAGATGAAQLFGLGWTTAIDWSAQFVSDLNDANLAATAATLGTYVSAYISNTADNQIDLSGPLEFGTVNELSALSSMLSYSAYSFYGHLAESFDFQWTNLYDWMKYTVGTLPNWFSPQDQPGARYAYFDGHSQTALLPGSNPFDNQYLRDQGQFYDPLVQTLKEADIEVVSVSSSPEGFAPGGDDVEVHVTLNNLGLGATKGKVKVDVEGATTGYTDTIWYSYLVDLYPGVEVVVDVPISGLLQDSYTFTVAVINHGPEVESNLGNNSQGIPFSVGVYRPVIYRRIPNVEFPAGGSITLNLDDYVSDPDSSLNELSWQAAGYANVGVDIQPNHTVIIESNWVGTENVTFRVADPSGRWDSQEISVSSFQGTGLQNPQVTPESGEKGDTFTFSVEYVDPEGRQPENVWIILNEVLHNATYDSGQAGDGALYTYATDGLVLAENSFYFKAYDGERYYWTDRFERPQLTEFHDLAVKEFSVNPEDPKADDVVEVKARIENIGTVTEDDVVVTFKVNGQPTADPVTLSLIPGETSEFIVFTYAFPLSDRTEDYELAIEAGPVSGETNTADNVESKSVIIVPLPGAVKGWVYDEFDTPIEGATVRVIADSTDDRGSTKTDADGYFFLDGLKPTPAGEDRYTLEASAPGQESVIRTNVAVHTQVTTGLEPPVIYLGGASLIASGQRDLNRLVWYPDGSQLLFTEYIPAYSYSVLKRIDKDGTNPPIQMTGAGKPIIHVYDSMSVSPDGTRIAVAGRADGDQWPGIWIMNANGDGEDATPKRQTSGVMYGAPTWKDNQSIAYVKGVLVDHQWAYSICAYTDHETTIVGGVDGYTYLSWSPNGQWLATTGPTGGHILDATSGEVLISKSNLYCPQWLHDSSGVLYERGADIWLYYMDSGEDVQITFGSSHEKYPSMPRNGDSKLAFLSNKGFPSVGQYGIYTMEFAVPGLYFENVSASPDPFTPNGDGLNDLLDISYGINKDANVTLKIHDSQGYCVRTLLDNEFQASGQHVASWDGMDQAGNRENAEVYFYRLDMKGAADMTESAMSAHGRIAMLKDIRQIGSSQMLYSQWSPDGSRIVYTDGGVLCICDADGSNHQIIDTPHEVFRRPVWDVGGQHIIFPSNNAGDLQIARINIDGTGYEELTHKANNSLWEAWFPSVSPTTGEIVVNGRWDEGDPNNRYYCIARINADGSGLEQMGNYIGDVAYRFRDEAPTWSPDGNWIVYGADKNYDHNTELYLIQRDGSSEQQITNSPYHDVFPEFVDNSRLLFVSSVRPNYGLWTMILDGSDQPRCISKYSSAATPSPSNDMILAGNQILELFLSLTKGAVEGRVLDCDTLLPIQGATVLLYDADVLVASTVTNAQGGYQFYNIEPGHYAVEVQAGDYVSSDSLAVTSAPWVVSMDNDIQLMRLPSVGISEISDGEVIGSLIAVHSQREQGEVSTVRYEYRAAGGQWQEIDTTYYGLPGMFDTDGLVSGDYEIRATGIDALGNEDESPGVIGISIDHTAPSASVSSPTEGWAVSGIVTVTGRSGDGDLASVVFQYRRTGDVLWVSIGGVDTDDPWSREWDTSHLLPGAYELRAVAIDTLGNIDEEPQAMAVHVAGSVIGRHIFYNHSSFDGNDPAANASDDGAIAPARTALLPGGTPTAANCTSYIRGINGIMVDIDGLARPAELGAGDFLLRIGDVHEPDSWADAPIPTSVIVREGAGTGGSERVTIIWEDNAIEDIWLEVTVLASENTGLATPDVFYWNNRRGDATGDGSVDAGDIDAVFAAIGSQDGDCDLNQDGAVNKTDVDSLVHDVLCTEYGDFTLDGDVDLDDLTILGTHYGSTGGETWATGDLDGDGDVDLDDLTILGSHYGQSMAMPPTVAAVMRNDGADRASELTALAFSFSKDVGASIGVGDLTLFNETTGALVDMAGATVNYDSGPKTARWDLTAMSLDAAYYTATLSASGITDIAGNPLDGNDDGDGGDDYQLLVLVALGGDSDRDGDVDLDDLTVVGTYYGTENGGTWATADFDADGDVDLDDLTVLGAHYGQDVNPPAVPEAPDALSSEADLVARQAAMGLLDGAGRVEAATQPLAITAARAYPSSVWAPSEDLLPTRALALPDVLVDVLELADLTAGL